MKEIWRAVDAGGHDEKHTVLRRHGVKKTNKYRTAGSNSNSKIILTATLSNSAASKKQTRAFWRGSRNCQLRLLSIAWVFSRLGKNKKVKGKIVEFR